MPVIPQRELTYAGHGRLVQVIAKDVCGYNDRPARSRASSEPAALPDRHRDDLGPALGPSLGAAVACASAAARPLMTLIPAGPGGGARLQFKPARGLSSAAAARLLAAGNWEGTRAPAAQRVLRARLIGLVRTGWS